MKGVKQAAAERAKLDKKERLMREDQENSKQKYQEWLDEQKQKAIDRSKELTIATQEKERKRFQKEKLMKTEQEESKRRHRVIATERERQKGLDMAAACAAAEEAEVPEQKRMTEQVHPVSLYYFACALTRIVP